MVKNSFSSLKRKEIIEKLSTSKYDVLIIGGGITGAGVALDAVSRGLKTALVEKMDYAWGTSSRSTKLIHGGLRYLKQFEVGLVREVGRERAIVHQNAIHLVRPKKMLLPIVENGSLGKTMSSIGLWIYDFLADVKNTEKRRMLDAKETLKLEPLLRKDGLKGGGLYYEYRTDDARLTIEILKKAAELGADILNYTEFRKFQYQDELITGAKVKDLVENEKFEIKTKYIVNACGPWVDSIRELDQEKIKNKRLRLSKGVHIVVDQEKFPIKQAIYFDVAADDRMIFAIPRDKKVYIGTTDTVYSDSIDDPYVTKEDVQYILDACTNMFPNVILKVKDVESSWVGLRPLIFEDGKDSSQLSRKDEIFVSKSGLVTIAGGKLTGYRKMAERTIDKLIALDQNKSLSPKFPECQTEKLSLAGSNFKSKSEFKEYRKHLFNKYAKKQQIDLDDVKYLLYKFGSNTEIILKYMGKIPMEMKKDQRMALASIRYLMEYEQCNNLCDAFIRRSSMLYFERPKIKDIIDVVVDEMALALGWTKKTKAKHISDFHKEFKKVLQFR